MKLYAIKWQGEEIKEGDWFKSLGCAISAITHFDGRVVEHVVERNGGGMSGPWYTHSKDETHKGKTGLALKLWWAEQQETNHLLSIPGICESIRAGMAEPIEGCSNTTELTEGGAA